ncbi:MAG TPA: serine/threonine-protein kinase [Polyangiaceae bacterium]|nr:serine/threonine-protein kinase [Polyangiaceae bacterium]
MSSACSRCGLVCPGLGIALCPRCLLSADAEDGDSEDDVSDVDNASLRAAALEVPGLRLARVLGRGAMGQVWLARHVRLDRDVAVKVIAPELALDAAFVARFEREARALARLNHPHVVSIYDFGVTEQGMLYLVMEYAPGGTLSERIPMRPAAAVEVLLVLCDAVFSAHQSGLVHRDIKPHNVLFDAHGRAKVADFGLARGFELDATDGLTRSGLVVGTPPYMAPEARAGAPPHPAADQYALGVLLRELVTGTPAPSDRPLPEALRGIVRRATAEAATDRYADVKSLQTALRGVLSTLGETKERAAGDRRSTHIGLPPEERSWLQAVSLTFAGANALALYAFLTSFTPRVLPSEDTLPMIAFGVRALPDGRVFSRARFETWPTLAAGAGFAIALAAYGLLRRHWRIAGLEQPQPDAEIESGTRALQLGIVLFALFIAHRVLALTPLRAVSPFLPVLGGTLEFLLLYLVWHSLLEAVRCQRSWLKEYRVWLGLLLGLIPPGFHFFELLLKSP